MTSHLPSTTAAASPAKAQAAQIPLQTFTIPTFPPEALEADIKDLILTSDIILDDYSALLEGMVQIPELPKSIRSLTLEGFMLGFPPRFLPSLTTQLPNLTSLTLYSLTLGGPSPHGSQKEDALQLINTPGLRELHVIDVFTSAGFWTQSSPQALKVVEFAYKYRREEEGLFEFLDIDGIVEFMGRLREVVGLTVCLSLDGEAGTGRIDAVRGEKARRFAEAVEKVGKELVVLDGTMFELQLDEVDAFLKADLKLKVLAISISLDGGWDKTLARLSETETGIQELEVVGVDYNGEFVGLEKEWVGAFEGKWSELRSVKVSVLKSGSEHWVKQNGTWTKRM